MDGAATERAPVTAATGAPAAAVGSPVAPPWLAGWLLGCALLVVALVVVGGYTRLSHSGLSIVEWRPVTGVLPPLGARAWEEAFAAYRASPEFRLANPDLAMAGFRRIYWVEWSHRLLARVAGLALGGPLLVLAWNRRLERRLLARLVVLLLLFAAQGALGWAMVASGLVDRPQVSAYRLTAHLLLAVALLAALLWTALDLLAPRRPPPRRRPLAWLAGATVAAALLTIAWGGLMAGTRAGLVCNSLPCFVGQWLPDGRGALRPWWRNLGENLLTVQIMHRGLALLTLTLAALWWWRAGRLAGGRPRRLQLVLAAALVQVALGVATLLLVVPLPLALLHQAGAIALLATLLVAAHGQPA